MQEMETKSEEKPLYFMDYIRIIAIKQNEILKLLYFLLENWDRLQDKEWMKSWSYGGLECPNVKNVENESLYKNTKKQEFVCTVPSKRHSNHDLLVLKMDTIKCPSCGFPIYCKWCGEPMVEIDGYAVCSREDCPTNNDSKWNRLKHLYDPDQLAEWQIMIIMSDVL